MPFSKNGSILLLSMLFAFAEIPLLFTRYFFILNCSLPAGTRIPFWTFLAGMSNSACSVLPFHFAHAEIITLL